MSKKRKGIFDTEVVKYYPPIQTPTYPPPQPLPNVNYGLRETPQGRADTLEAGVYVPTLQAVVLGLAWGIVAGMVAGAVAFWQSWPWWVVPLVGAASSALVGAYHLTGGIQLRQSLLWKREELRRDPDGDVVGQPALALEPVTVRLELTGPEPGRTQFLNLDIGPERMSQLCRSVLAGRSLSEGEWTGAGRPFSRAEFRNLRGLLIERGLVRWNNDRAKAQGVTLTAAGRAVFRKLADLPPTVEG